MHELGERRSRKRVLYLCYNTILLCCIDHDVFQAFNVSSCSKLEGSKIDYWIYNKLTRSMVGRFASPRDWDNV